MVKVNVDIIQISTLSFNILFMFIDQSNSGGQRKCGLCKQPGNKFHPLISVFTDM